MEKRIPCEVKTDKIGPTELKLELMIPNVYIEERFNSEIAKQAKQVTIPGFRPGKAPADMVKRNYGADIHQKTVSAILGEAVEEAMISKDIKAVSSPRLVDAKEAEGGLHTFILNVDVFPEFKVNKYKNLKLPKIESELKKEDIENEIAAIRNYTAQVVPVEENRAVDHNDVAMIDYRLEVAGIDLGENAAAEGVQVSIGEKRFIEGFEDGLKGMKKGDTKTLNLVFPKEYHDVKVAGKDAVFHVTLKELKTKKMHENEDDLAKAIGFETAAQMREKMEAGMKVRKADEAKNQMTMAIKQALVAENHVDVPNSMLHERAHYMQDMAANNLMKNQGYTEQMAKEQVHKWHDQFHKNAEEELKAEFLLNEIATMEKIEATDEDVNAKFEEMSKASNHPVEKIKDLYSKDRRRMEYLKIAIREEKTLNFVKDNSK